MGADLLVNATKLESARASFAQLIAAHRYPGGQLAVRVAGQEVLSWAGGTAIGWRDDEGHDRVPMGADTLVPVFSAGKPVAGAAVLVLHDRGQLELQEAIAAHLSGFAAHGKSSITVLDVLTHRSGILTPELCADVACWQDLARLRHQLCRVTPTYRRGTLAYAPFEYGWLLGAVIEHVAGKAFPGVVRDLIAAPAHLDDLLFSVPASRRQEIAHVYWLGPRRMMVAGVNVADGFEETNNSPAFFDADVPGAGLVTNAASLAAFYDLLLPGLTGPRLVSDAALVEWLSSRRLGWDRSNGVPLRVGRGLLFGTWFPSVYGRWGTSSVFGHAGAFGVLGFADPDRSLSGAIVTNGHRGRYDMLRDFAPIVSAIRRACRPTRV